MPLETVPISMLTNVKLTLKLIFKSEPNNFLYTLK